MQKVNLAAEVRTHTGKKATKALRRAGNVPASLYGPGRTGALSISLNRRDLEKIAHSGSALLINLEIAGEGTVQTLLRGFDGDRVRGDLIHADFYQVAENQTLHTEIPVEITGASIGVREGGILERAIREVEIECLPRDLPDHIVVDVTPLAIGDSIHVGDLELPPGVTIRHPEPTTTLVHVVPPRIIEEEVPAEAEAVEGVEPAEAVQPGAEAEAAEEGGGG